MKLRVFTRTEVVFDEEVAHVTVEDPTGSPGIRAGRFAIVRPGECTYRELHPTMRRAGSEQLSEGMGISCPPGPHELA
ncbi:MAG: hypothetical protein ACYTKD_31285 [Planctomycetota bacterium]|jgi:hypothetical protein